MCEPKNRDARPCFAGLLVSRMIANMTMPMRTRTAKRSSITRTTCQVPKTGIEKFSMTSSPKAVTTVMPRMMNPQKAKTCATPGTVHFSNLRWPSTSVASASTRLGASEVRPTACLPARPRLTRNQPRLSAKASRMTVMAMPTMARTSM